jgi:hypothetical protein
MMKEHEFTLVLSDDPSDDAAERLYATFDDGTISTSGGVATIAFHRERESLEEAIRSAIGDVQVCGLTVKRVELEPRALSPAS